VIAALIQARLGSRRLPGKVMEPIEGEPLIWRVYERVRRARLPELTAVITGSRARNEALAAFLESRGVPLFHGDDDDVLDRTVAAADHFGASAVVRVTGDCPLIDPDIVDDVVGLFRTGNYDYASNVHPPTYPDGLDVEVVSLAALERAHREAVLLSEREHVTPFIWKHEHVFRIGNLRAPRDLSSLRWTVDDVHDLAFVREVFRQLGGGERDFHMQDVLDLLAERPDLARTAVGARNAGYARSLETDEAPG
jgi:spore coat polysaccharide biosynthesis protein SpsF